MSRLPHRMHAVPSDTARVAQAALPNGHLAMPRQAARGTRAMDDDVADRFPPPGQPAACPWRLALLWIRPWVEHRSDRQAAEAVRRRLDSTYALGLEGTDPSVAWAVRSACRARRVAGHAALRLMARLWERRRALRRLKPRGRPRTDSTPVLAARRSLKRLERGGATRRAALNRLAVVGPAWWPGITPLAGDDRDGRRVETSHRPKPEAARRALATVMGRDGPIRRDARDAIPAQRWLQAMPAMHTRC
jgi:hypothetical protein